MVFVYAAAAAAATAAALSASAATPPPPPLNKKRLNVIRASQIMRKADGREAPAAGAAAAAEAGEACPLHFLRGQLNCTLLLATYPRYGDDDRSLTESATAVGGKGRGEERSPSSAAVRKAHLLRHWRIGGFRGPWQRPVAI